MRSSLYNMVLILRYLKKIAEMKIDLDNVQAFFNGYAKTITHCKCCKKELWLAGNDSDPISYDEILSYAKNRGWNIEENSVECPKCNYNKLKNESDEHEHEYESDNVIVITKALNYRKTPR